MVDLAYDINFTIHFEFPEYLMLFGDHLGQSVSLYI